MSLADTPLVLGNVKVTPDTLNGAATGILVDSNHGRVGDNRKVGAGPLAKIGSKKERRFQGSPQGEVRFVLFTEVSFPCIDV